MLSWGQPGRSEGVWDGRLEQPALGIPRSFLRLQEGHVHTLSPREEGNWWLGEEVTGTASEVNHQPPMGEIRLRNILRAQDLVSQQKGESFQNGIRVNQRQVDVSKIKFKFPMKNKGCTSLMQKKKNPKKPSKNHREKKKKPCSFEGNFQSEVKLVMN